MPNVHGHHSKKRSSDSNHPSNTSRTSLKNTTTTVASTSTSNSPNNIHNIIHRNSERVTTIDIPMVSSLMAADVASTKRRITDQDRLHLQSKQVEETLAEATKKIAQVMDQFHISHRTTSDSSFQSQVALSSAFSTWKKNMDHVPMAAALFQNTKYGTTNTTTATQENHGGGTPGNRSNHEVVNDVDDNHPYKKDQAPCKNELDDRWKNDDGKDHPNGEEEEDHNDDDEEEEEDHNDHHHVVGVCLHCGMSPSTTSFTTGSIMASTLGPVIPCSSSTTAVAAAAGDHGGAPTNNPSSTTSHHQNATNHFPIQDYNHHTHNSNNNNNNNNNNTNNCSSISNNDKKNQHENSSMTNKDEKPTNTISDTSDTSLPDTQTAVGVQVSCDECHSFICTSCHWCHEYQANHEIRVCDRCDAFYCKGCDEMDQCEDCGEVVCEGCGALCSCKFCGCGLCEDCATACGRCGIVLCSRDSKFAVECDTCKMSYCLVCLASGTKDPCVRCGHRTSKRVEQLVHLRLKSIYKAFKQSTSMKVQHHEIKSMVADKNQGNASAREIQSEKECVGAVLQVAAAAAAAASSMQSSKSTSSSFTIGNMDASALNETIRDLSAHSMNPTRIGLAHSNMFPQQKTSKKNPSDKFAAKTTAEADAAAAALLAELEEEMLNAEANNNAKKSKKKKKKEKEKQNAKEKEEQTKKDAEEKVAEKLKVQKHGKEVLKQPTAVSNVNINKDSDKVNASSSSMNAVKILNSTIADRVLKPDESSNDSEEDDVKSNNVKTSEIPHLDDDNDIEVRLALAISLNDVDGIEEILVELKGIPGRAALRKNAKKAVKKIREDQEAAAAEQISKDEKELAQTLHSALGGGGDTARNGATEFKPTDPLVTTVSSTHRLQSSAGPARFERVLSMAPSVVGWVIGKGGQRIRDLMEESGAKVWIDQESMGPNDRRIVYVSGSKKSVDTAVRTIKDLVNTAPTGSTNNPGSATVTTVASTGGVPNNLTVPEFEDIVSTRSSLTSTPISMANSSQQATLSSQKQYSASPRKDLLHHSEQYNVLPPISLPPAVDAASSSTRERSILPPPGLSSMLNPSPSLLKVEDIRKEIVCEKRFVPLLIGRRGWTVKHIQDTSGARVDIDQNVNPPLIIISGMIEQVREAERQVQEILNYPHAQSNYSEGSAEDENDIDVGILAGGLRSENIMLKLHPSGAPQVNDVSSGFFDDRGFFMSTPRIPQVQSPFAYVHGNSNSQNLFDSHSMSSYQQQKQPQHQNSSFGFFDHQNQSLNHSMTGSAFGNPRHEDQFFARQAASNSFTSQFPERASSINNFENEAILPLSMNQSSYRNQYDRFGRDSSSNLFRMQPTFPLGRTEHEEVSDEYNIVNTLFSGPYVESQMNAIGDSQHLMPSFNNAPGGACENGMSFDWDSLVNQNMNNSSDPSNRRSVGLGGVRLDMSQDNAPSNSPKHGYTNRQTWGR